MKAQTVFITIKFEGVEGISDYPQNIPLPQIGHTVIMDVHKSGKVYDVRHTVTETVVDIKILCSKYE